MSKKGKEDAMEMFSRGAAIADSSDQTLPAPAGALPYRIS